MVYKDPAKRKEYYYKNQKVIRERQNKIRRENRDEWNNYIKKFYDKEPQRTIQQVRCRINNHIRKTKNLDLIQILKDLRTEWIDRIKEHDSKTEYDEINDIVESMGDVIAEKKKPFLKGVINPPIQSKKK